MLLEQCVSQSTAFAHMHDMLHSAYMLERQRHNPLRLFTMQAHIDMERNRSEYWLRHPLYRSHHVSA